MEEEFLATVVSEEQAQLLIPSMGTPMSLPHLEMDRISIIHKI
jgi:hypothetical protein